MENKLVSYETMYIIDSTGSEETTAALVNKFKTLIEQNGTIESFNEWGKRKLAYEINFKSEGYYVLMNFTAEANVPAEIERQMREASKREKITLLSSRRSCVHLKRLRQERRELQRKSSRFRSRCKSFWQFERNMQILW